MASLILKAIEALASLALLFVPTVLLILLREHPLELRPLQAIFTFSVSAAAALARES
jgi:hypothetical protein